MKAEDKKWLSERFGIPEDDIIWYNSGICYSRIHVKTYESAIKVSKAVSSGVVNGGLLDGMPLGSFSKYMAKDGSIYYDVTC
jgi:hypothetical protein